MDEWDKMLAAANRVDELYQQKDIERIGRVWTLAEFISQCNVDWGELCEHIGVQQGFRSGDVSKEQIEHELADMLWALIVIADRTEVDLKSAFLDTMDELSSKLDK